MDNTTIGILALVAIFIFIMPIISSSLLSMAGFGTYFLIGDDKSMTEPSVTDPPVTVPTITDPHVTEPPVTEPPATGPPVTDPPVTDPPVTEPQIDTLNCLQQGQNFGEDWYEANGQCFKCSEGYDWLALETDINKKCLTKLDPEDTIDRQTCKQEYGENGIFDIQNGGECWSCPEGTSHTFGSNINDKPCRGLDMVNPDYTNRKTCENEFERGFFAGGHCYQCPEDSTRHGLGIKCKKANVSPNYADRKTCGQEYSGGFFANGKCYVCPTGYTRDGLSTSCKKSHEYPEYKTRKTCKQEFGTSAFWANDKCYKCPAGTTRVGLGLICKKAPQTKSRNTCQNDYGNYGWTGYDLKKDGCWTCPSGYNRDGLYPVDNGKGCIKKVNIQRKNKGTGIFKSDCPSGQWLNVGNGYCYGCPSGTSRAGLSNKCDSFVAGAYRRKGVGPSGLTICDNGWSNYGDKCRKCESGYNWDGINCIKQAPAVDSAKRLGSSGLTECTGGYQGDITITDKCWKCKNGSVRDNLVGINNKACIPKKSAIYKRVGVGLSGLTKCPTGYNEDLSITNKCWKCPPGTIRDNSIGINGEACIQLVEASKKRQGVGLTGLTPCTDGYNEDLIPDKCWKCPTDTQRDYSIGINNASCFLSQPANFQRKGVVIGGLTVCPEGYTSRGNKCIKCPNNSDIMALEDKCEQKQAALLSTSL